MFLADSPFLEGTSLGPKMLALILNLFEMGLPDKKIAWLLHAMYNFEVAENTITAARHSMAEKFEDLIGRIAAAIQLYTWIMINQTMFKRGDGRYGYVWVVNTPIGVPVVFSDTRSAIVLNTRLKCLEGKTAMCDGYPGFFSEIQRCWRHVLAKAEELAVRNNDYEYPYDILLRFYKNIQGIANVSPFTVMELSRQVHYISKLFGNTSAGTYLRNSIPNLFTFLRYPGMPLHNDTEREIRDGVVSQRNARHKLVTAESKETFGRLLTVTRTASKQGISPGRALVELVQNPSWDITRSKDTPFSYVNPDGSSYSVFDSPGPPDLAEAVCQVQAAGMHVIIS